MLRSLTPTALAITIAVGSAIAAHAMQGPRTGNPPGPEVRIPMQGAATGQLSNGSGMVGQTDKDMMGNPQMQAQMAQKMQNCPCCVRMAQTDREQRQR
jgi:hypothetical protein